MLEVSGLLLVRLHITGCLLHVGEADLLSRYNGPRGIHMLYESLWVEPVVCVWTAVVIES